MKSLLLVTLLASSPAISQASAAPQGATELKSLTLFPQDGGLLAVFLGDGPLEHRVVQEQNPGQRLVLDVLGVRNPLRHYYAPESHPFLERILMYEYPEATNPNHRGPLARIVFELKREVDYRITTNEHELHVTFTDVPRAGSSESEYFPPPTDDACVPTNGGADAAETDAAAWDPDAPLDTSAPAADNGDEPYDPNVPPNVSIQPDDIPTGLFFDVSPIASGDYRLGPEDVVEVKVFELEQLNRKVRVSGDGFVDLPLVGSVRAAGLTGEEVAAEVADRLRDRYVQNPQVSIFIVEFNSQKVSLLGAVQSPSSYPLVGQRRLLQLLAEAGSLTPEAGKTLYVFRQTRDGRSARLTVPLNDLLLHGDPRWNIQLMPGDVVSIPPEEAIAVSVLGAVNSPGVHKLPVGDEATLLKAVALAGGLNERASKKGIQIKRRGADGKEAILKVNLGDILSGKAPDVILMEGDVVVVNESFF